VAVVGQQLPEKQPDLAVPAGDDYVHRRNATPSGSARLQGVQALR
jgi:hypothetical protein